MKYVLKYAISLLIVVSIFGSIAPATNVVVAATVTLEDLLRQLEELKTLLNQRIEQQSQSDSVTIEFKSPTITAFVAAPFEGNEDYNAYQFAWASQGAKYCKISDDGEFFPLHNRYAASGLANKKLPGLDLNVFTLHCYNSAGNYDYKKIALGSSEDLPSIPQHSYLTQSDPKGWSCYGRFSLSADGTYCIDLGG